MNLKKRIRGFFTLTRKADGGFTLVELIVVIAILAILSGIAVPAYSGYIEKANTAADEQLLASLNTAFAAACAINGENNYGRSGVNISLTGETGSKQVESLTVPGNDNIADAFMNDYYEGGVFKVITGLYYDGTIGGFKGSENGLLNQTGYRKDYADAAKGYYGSDNSYLGNEADLLTTVGTFSTALSEFLTDEEKMAKLLEDPTFAAFCEDKGFDTSDPNTIANAMVMYAAQELSDVNPSAIHSSLVNSYDAENSRYNLMDMVDVMNGEDGTPADMALDGAVLAAVIAGYANSDYASEEVKEYYTSQQGTVTNATTLFKYLNGVIDAGVTTDDDGVKTDSFAQYLNSQGATDIEAFTGGLGAVYYGTDDLITAAGQGDEAFNALIADLLGGTWTGSSN